MCVCVCVCVCVCIGSQCVDTTRWPARSIHPLQGDSIPPPFCKLQDQKEDEIISSRRPQILMGIVHVTNASGRLKKLEGGMFEFVPVSKWKT